MRSLLHATLHVTYISSLILQMMKLEVKSLAQEDSQHEVESGFKPSLPDRNA